MCTVTERLWEPTCAVTERSHRAIAGDIRQRQATVVPAKMAHRGLTIHSKNSCRDGGIRTRGLLLPNQLYPAATRSLTSPRAAFTWDNAGLTSPCVAPYLCMLAPTLAPSQLVVRRRFERWPGGSPPRALPPGQQVLLEDRRGCIASLGGDRDRVGHVVCGWARRHGAGIFKAVAGASDAAERPEDEHG